MVCGSVVVTLLVEKWVVLRLLCNGKGNNNCILSDPRANPRPFW